MTFGGELREIAAQIWGWQVAQFGDALTLDGALNKLRDEVGEAIAAGEARPAPGEAFAPYDASRRAELADAFIMLVQAAGMLEALPALMRQCVHTQPDIKTAPYADSLRMVHALAVTAKQLHLRDRSIGAAVFGWAGACKAHGDLVHMPAAIRRKMEVNKARAWGQPAADGTISHVKAAE